MKNSSAPRSRRRSSGMIHYNTEVIDADRQGKSPYDFSQTVTAEITKIKEKIDQNSNL